MRNGRRLYARPAQVVVKPQETFWLRWLKRFVMALGTFVLLGFLLGLLSRCAFNDEMLPRKFILTAQFTGTLNEGPDRLAFFAPPEDDFYRVLATLKQGAKDPKVKALIVHIWNGQYSISQIKEIRAVLNEWRAVGKPTYAYSDSLGDGAMGMASYWLATAFDHIWVQPLGFVTMNGFRAEMPFGRGALDKLGVVPEFFAYTTYKTAMDMFTQKQMRDADRKQLTVMLNGMNDEFIMDVASARSLQEDEVRGFIKRAPFMAEDAARMKLIDQAGYGDELGWRVRLGLKDEQVPFVSLPDYMPDALAAATAKAGKTKIAMINVEGMITDAMTMPEDIQGGSPLTGSAQLCVSCAILQAGEDPHIAAILLRLNTPGGSPTASETIRRAMIVARAKGKKVVVSMGDTAASGGYWIASGADKIVAQPTTLTGSIGVVGGKFALRDLFEKYGVHWQDIKADVTAPDMGSMVDTFSPEAATRQKENLSRIYEAFKERVEQGRNYRDAEPLAQGRVWLGKDALRLRLVDELGGMEQAKTMLAIMLNLKSVDDLSIISYMPTPSPLQGLKSLLGLPGVVARLQLEWMKMNAALNAPAIQATADIPVIVD